MRKRALITGITGQDGSYLAELLIAKGYAVHGLVRRTSSASLQRIERLFPTAETTDDNRLHENKLHFGDLADSSSLYQVLSDVRPDEVYNLGAQSDVKISFDVPEYTGDVVGTGTLRLLEAIRKGGLHPRIYQAGSSEMFGKAREVPQSERTAFYPRSPYAAAKVYAHWLCVNYREAYDMFICNGILFNHESPRRGDNFVTRKITLGAAAIKLGMQDSLVLGNLEARRDWGYAKDYVEAMWLMLQQDHPDDYVIATGQTHSVREFCESAFAHLGLDYQEYVEKDERLFRPTEVDLLRGDAGKAERELGWSPSTTFEQLVELMVEADVEFLKGMPRHPSDGHSGAPVSRGNGFHAHKGAR
jgi:GDPmannose 4,6-dehydratase